MFGVMVSEVSVHSPLALLWQGRRSWQGAHGRAKWLISWNQDIERGTQKDRHREKGARDMMYLPKTNIPRDLLLPSRSHLYHVPVMPPNYEVLNRLIHS